MNEEYEEYTIYFGKDLEARLKKLFDEDRELCEQLIVKYMDDMMAIEPVGEA